MRVLAAVVLFCGVGYATVAAQPAGDLAGTSWRLVKFQGGDDTTLTPDDPSKYTLEFGAGGQVSARIDCNRGRGQWELAGPNQLRFGPMALTRAMCPPGSLHDHIVKHWDFIRSYVVRDGRLYLSLMADGGIYEFEPATEGKAAGHRSPVASTGPVTFRCSAGQTAAGALRATFYETNPAMVLLEREGSARPAFQVVAASGAKYKGDDVMFWEARGEAAVEWLEVRLTCAPDPAPPVR